MDKSFGLEQTHVDSFVTEVLQVNRFIEQVTESGDRIAVVKSSIQEEGEVNTLLNRKYTCLYHMCTFCHATKFDVCARKPGVQCKCFTHHYVCLLV